MFPQRIKELRLKKKLTQQEVATHLGITRPAYTAYESGKREPDFAILQRLAELFDVTTDYLLGANQTPDWADKDDLVELDKLLDSNVNMAFNGENLTEEEKQRVKDVLTGIFWKIRKQDKDKEM
ncbi:MULTISPECIES: helix-turn-helix transcriptional regulator [unclassified Enterococcus]|uniref:helix-turn-helix domain-containing protein n=1 Tax=unclassified Enterococcus TaxID=2608891 RepID=UPI0013ECCFE8|nr:MULTISPECIES: helix-turn-helix transcriptional regulator [unclassified Enterococcus]